MGRIHLTFYSNALKQRTDVNVFIPESVPERYTTAQLPVIYLLHGLSGSRDDWMLNTSLARYVERYKLIVVCPEGARGFYLDLPQEPAWYSYVTEELPQQLAAWMKIGQAREQCFVAGNSMGGYGAARIQALRPAHYRGMAAFSAPLGIEMLAILHDAEPAFFDELKKMIGREPQTLINTDMDPKQWIERYASWQKSNPAEELDISFFCGLEDDFLPLNRRFAYLASEAGIRMKYYEAKGGHEFHYWDAALHDWLKHVAALYYVQAEIAEIDV